MAINDVYVCSLRFSINGEKTANVIHFEQTAADGVLPVNEDLCAAVIEDIWPSYKAILSNDAHLQTVAARKVAPAVGGSVSVVVNEAGSVSADTTPPNSAAVATLYSETLTREGRGRIYISGLPDTWVDSNHIVNTNAATIVTFLNKLLDPIQAGSGCTFQAGVWSLGSGTFHDYTKHQLRAVLHNLRSRRMANP